jgi:PTH1 family peptidyl-tRNA hydrolase
LVVAGLGNPGAQYARTRHNAGRMALDVLVDRTSAALKRHRSGCLVAETRIGDRPAVLAHPVAYMNDSGRPLGALLRWYKATPDALVVLHDELDIPFGQVRVKRAGGIAGHNGLRSVAAHLATREFGRVRIGISRPRAGRDPVDWVLTEFSAAERSELPGVLERAADAVESLAGRGWEATMNEFNTRAG